MAATPRLMRPRIDKDMVKYEIPSMGYRKTTKVVRTCFFDRASIKHLEPKVKMLVDGEIVYVEYSKDLELDDATREEWEDAFNDEITDNLADAITRACVRFVRSSDFDRLLVQRFHVYGQEIAKIMRNDGSLTVEILIPLEKDLALASKSDHKLKMLLKGMDPFHHTFKFDFNEPDTNGVIITGSMIVTDTIEGFLEDNDCDGCLHKFKRFQKEFLGWIEYFQTATDECKAAIEKFKLANKAQIGQEIFRKHITEAEREAIKRQVRYDGNKASFDPQKFLDAIQPHVDKFFNMDRMTYAFFKWIDTNIIQKKSMYYRNIEDSLVEITQTCESGVLMSEIIGLPLPVIRE